MLDSAVVRRDGPGDVVGGPQTWERIVAANQVHRLILGAGITLSLLLVPLPFTELTGGLYTAVGAATVVLLVTGVRVRRPHRMRAWSMLAGAMGLTVVGDVIFVLLDLSGEVPFPSVADAAYLASYVLYAAALWELGRRGGTDRGILIDAAIVGIAAAVLGWVYIMAPYVDDQTLTMPERIISLAYPVGDLILIPLIVRLVFAHAANIPAHIYVLVGMLLYLVGDVAFGIGILSGWYESGGLVDAMLLSAHVIFAAAVWHPSARDEPPAIGVDVSLSSQRLAALATASVLAPMVVLLNDISEGYTVEVAAFASIVLFLLVIQRMAGLMRQIHRQSAELAALSRTDPLTGAANRRHMDEELHRAVVRSERAGARLTVALLDLDRFKAFNDTYGHQAGDDLLRDAVSGWQSELRELDLLARFGGEEFLVIISDTPADQAERVVERLRARVPHGQTCSAGIAHLVDGETEADLIQRADRALYEAKESGRDRSVVAGVQPV